MFSIDKLKPGPSGFINKLNGIIKPTLKNLKKSK